MSEEIEWITDPDSPDLEPDRIMNFLYMGRRTPQNETEKKLLKELKKMERKGIAVDMPSNGIY